MKFHIGQRVKLVNRPPHVIAGYPSIGSTGIISALSPNKLEIVDYGVTFDGHSPLPFTRGFGAMEWMLAPLDPPKLSSWDALRELGLDLSFNEHVRQPEIV